jgi:hypothetical protein
MAAQYRFNLSGLDTEAAHLELSIGAAKEFDNSIGAPAGAITAVVLAPVWREGVRLKALCGKPWLSHITERNAIATNPQVAGHADRHWLTFVIENVHARVGNWATYRNGSDDDIARSHTMRTSECGSLSRSVAVYQHSVPRQRSQRSPHMVGRKHVAAGKKLVQGAEHLRAVVYNAMEEACGEPQSGHVLASNDVRKFTRGKWSRRR